MSKPRSPKPPEITYEFSRNTLVGQRYLQLVLELVAEAFAAGAQKPG